eukprot:TRINITY_DN20397_c0_g1_i2.p1 TRINITY_DN20397_c0_g1~~TRINITY_DN20397_c0_g1_i2.p1  ORF type:complete len:117 (+),score=23.88 TRINITY_DN20397_c0_g1_i2:49-399(+)
MPALCRCVGHGAQAISRPLSLVSWNVWESLRQSSGRFIATRKAAAKTPLQMLAEELKESQSLSSQVGGLDAGIAGLNEMSAFESIAERRIQEAAAKGEFKNLPGQGRPLDSEARPV